MLLVLDPEYERAAFLKGNVKDSLSGDYISNATIRILTYNIVTSTTNLSGNYLIGIENGNTYNVEFSKEGYFTDTIEITLFNGQTITKNISLLPKESFEKNGKIIGNKEINFNQKILTKISPL